MMGDFKTKGDTLAIMENWRREYLGVIMMVTFINERVGAKVKNCDSEGKVEKRKSSADGNVATNIDKYCLRFVGSQCNKLKQKVLYGLPWLRDCVS